MSRHFSAHCSPQPWQIICSPGSTLAYKENLKCACVECGQMIGYASVQTGRVCVCPKCGRKSLFPGGPEDQPKPVSGSTSPNPKGGPPLIPGDKLPPLPRTTPIVKSDESPVRKCPACGCPLMSKDVNCPVCEGQRSRNRA